MCVHRSMKSFDDNKVTITSMVTNLNDANPFSWPIDLVYLHDLQYQDLEILSLVNIFMNK